MTDPRCGTRTGYNAHRRAHEPACDACRTAERDRARELAIRNAKACAMCGQPCSKDATICRVCNSKDAGRRAAVARQVKRDKARARQLREKSWPEEELRYSGAWVRRGLVLVPTVTGGEDEAA